jgi:hypothetical protein
VKEVNKGDALQEERMKMMQEARDWEREGERRIVCK